MSGAGAIDGKTHAVWGDAIVGALRGDRRELIDLLHRADVARLITPDAGEFIAWLLAKKSGPGRPTLPAKFKVFRDMARDPRLFEALDELHQRRLCWRGHRQKFPLEQHLDEVAQAFGVKRAALEREDRRSRESGRKIGY